MSEIEVRTTGAEEARVVELWLDGEQIAFTMTTPMAAICCCGSTPAGTAAPLRVDVRSLSKALTEVERVLAVY